MSFTCPECGRTSHNPNDERYRYCGACHKFFPGEADEPAGVVAISQLIIEARSVMASGAVLGFPAEHARHWRAVIAWLRAHLPPEHAAVSFTPPCRDCLDLGVRTEDGLAWEACSCLMGQYLDDISA